jgi:hypothetical protein
LQETWWDVMANETSGFLIGTAQGSFDYQGVVFRGSINY